MAEFNQSYADELFALSLNTWEGDNAVEYVAGETGVKKVRTRDELQKKVKKYLKETLQRITFKK